MTFNEERLSTIPQELYCLSIKSCSLAYLTI